MRLFISLFLIVGSLAFGSKVQMPSIKYVADASVTDMVYKDSRLYVATTDGVVDVFDTKKNKIVKKIKVKTIKNFMGTDVEAKIYSVDVLGDDILVLAQAEKGYREVYIYKKGKLNKIIDVSAKLDIAKAKFIDKNNIILALLSNDIISYNIVDKKQNWIKQASMSKFSNFALNEDKSQVVIADESGDLHLLATKDAQLLETLSGENLDNVFTVDFKNKKIITAGQDRRAVIYDLVSKSAYYEKTHFLIYSAGLSPSGKIGAYASDEQNNLKVFNTNTKRNLGTFGGNKMTLVKILFINETEFFVASDDKIINFYKLH
jgi:WD40 repeat protein